MEVCGVRRVARGGAGEGADCLEEERGLVGATHHLEAERALVRDIRTGLDAPCDEGLAVALAEEPDVVRVFDGRAGRVLDVVVARLEAGAVAFDADEELALERRVEEDREVRERVHRCKELQGDVGARVVCNGGVAPRCTDPELVYMDFYRGDCSDGEGSPRIMPSKSWPISTGKRS